MRQPTSLRSINLAMEAPWGAVGWSWGGGNCGLGFWEVWGAVSGGAIFGLTMMIGLLRSFGEDFLILGFWQIQRATCGVELFSEMSGLER